MTKRRARTPAQGLPYLLPLAQMSADERLIGPPSRFPPFINSKILILFRISGFGFRIFVFACGSAALRLLRLFAATFAIAPPELAFGVVLDYMHKV